MLFLWPTPAALGESLSPSNLSAFSFFCCISLISSSAFSWRKFSTSRVHVVRQHLHGSSRTVFLMLFTCAVSPLPWKGTYRFQTRAQTSLGPFCPPHCIYTSLSFSFFLHRIPLPLKCMFSLDLKMFPSHVKPCCGVPAQHAVPRLNPMRGCCPILATVHLTHCGLPGWGPHCHQPPPGGKTRHLLSSQEAYFSFYKVLKSLILWPLRLVNALSVLLFLMFIWVYLLSVPTLSINTGQRSFIFNSKFQKKKKKEKRKPPPPRGRCIISCY